MTTANYYAIRCHKCHKKYAIGSNAPSWKGDSASYNKIHEWIEKHWDKPVMCEKCGSLKKLDWANKSGLYRRSERNDWLALCRSCHIKMDMSDERRANISRSAKTRANTQEGKNALRKSSLARHDRYRRLEIKYKTPERDYLGRFIKLGEK